MQTDLKRIQSIITSINSSTENNVSNKASVQDQDNQRFNELKAELLSMYEELNVSRPTTDQPPPADTNNNNDDDTSINNDDDNDQKSVLSELLDIILDFINKLLKKAPEDSDDDENSSCECNAGENDNNNNNKCDKANTSHNGDNIQINVINTPEGDRADEDEDEESETDTAKNKSDKQIDVLVKEYVQSMHRQFAIRKEFKDATQMASRNGLFYAEIKNDINIHESNRKVQNKLLEEQSRQNEIMNTIAYLRKLNKERNESNKTNQNQNNQPV
jgi:hypothetical protein